MHHALRLAAALLLASGLLTLPAIGHADEDLSPGTGPRHAIAMHGEPLYPLDFEHFGYADPLAPKGGDLVVGEMGTFDSLNPYIVRGRPAWSIATGAFGRRVFESLMARSADEPFTLYGLLAETVETPEDRSWVAFTLRPEARFSDGSPVTVDDVIFSMETLRDQGRPNHRNFYSKVVRVDRLGERTVRFVFDPEATDREAPLLMGLMPILSNRYYTENEFDRTSMAPPLGSGPYVVARVDPGRSITYRRNPDYWGKELPVNRGLHNFDTVRHDYYRDGNALFEAFKAGLVHIRVEGDPARWANGYDFPAARDGRIYRDEIEHGRPSGMFALVFNTRRPAFSDVRVREALTLAFDFEWINDNFFHGAYRRTRSFFDNSELAAKGPASELERRILAPFPDAVRADILEHGWVPPVGGGQAEIRENLRQAVAILREAGYEIRNRRMINTATGRPLAFEIMIVEPDHERVALHYKRTLERLGIEVSLRTVDSSQFQQRWDNFDFDMMPFTWGGTLSPGNEQRFRWGSQMADIPGSFNLPGVRSQAVDAAIDALTAANSREELVAAARALDRLLLSGYYVLPLYHQAADRVAWWVDLNHPDRHALTGYRLEAWWMMPTN
jgi:peptide/nickel transport system substrate-binding protein